MDLKHAFGMTLKRVRKEKGFSQEGLALEADIGRSYMSDLERGISEPGLEMVFRICETLQIKPSEFVRKMERKVKIT